MNLRYRIKLALWVSIGSYFIIDIIMFLIFKKFVDFYSIASFMNLTISIIIFFAIIDSEKKKSKTKPKTKLNSMGGK